MRNFYTLFAVLFISITLNAQIVDIPDPILKNRLVTGYCVDQDGDGDGDTDADINNDGEIQISEAEAVLGLYLSCYNEGCRFSSMEGIEAFVNLEILEVQGNNLVSLDVSMLNNLTTLVCSTNHLTSIELGSLSNLTSIECGGNELTSIDVSLLSGLSSLECQSNPLSSINFGALSNLTHLRCTYIQMTSLDVSTLSSLTYLDCNYGQLTSLNVGSLTNLERLECKFNQLTTLDVSNLPNLSHLICDDNELTQLNVIDASNLTGLSCKNNQLTTLDLNTLSNLEGLTCSNNELNALDISLLLNLTSLDCAENQLSALNLDSASNLTYLNCSFNQIDALNLNNLINLTSLSCRSNQLTELDLSPIANLNTLNCSNNQISELDLTNASLNSLYCSNNLLTTLDLSNMTAQYLNCADNQLTTLNIKNGYINANGEILSPYDLRLLDFSNNPDLINVCADDEPIYAGNWPYYEINIVQNLINQYGYTTCAVNGYCSFIPGGDFYTIQGNVVLDSDNNDCDSNDSSFPNLNFSITDGTETGNYIANSSGAYMIPVQEGSHTITPTFEITSYFTISPSNVTVSFPSNGSPYIQDFCIAPNGTFNDLEITIIPIEAARPGFDTDYKIVYKNKGTTTLSGNINFGFEDEVMAFISSTPANESGLPDLLTYSFSDLEPFESRGIILTMNLNTPTDVNPLNGGDVLTFITSISSSVTEETPDDNTFELHQTVVNSFDPNDKTCLEGDTITPEMVGDYVHYMIRFENTGTADAINIVVKDDIDRTKYDLSTLIPLNASHDFTARLKDDGSDYYVEFIFENINLPFDDDNNDGFIVFKIRTLDTLVLDDILENEAEIYFDFNFPIITNNEQTTVAVLSTEEFKIGSNSIILYPNPTDNLLHLESNQAIEHITIYDISGRQIQDIAVVGHKTDLNISTEALSAGTYFMKIKIETGELARQFIKD